MKFNSYTVKFFIPGQNSQEYFWHIPGNEEVQTNQKKNSANLPVEGPEPFCGISLSVSKAGKSYWLRNAFCNYWDGAPKMKYTHEMISNTRQRRSKQLIDLSKKKLYYVFEQGYSKIQNADSARLKKKLPSIYQAHA